MSWRALLFVAALAAVAGASLAFVLSAPRPAFSAADSKELERPGDEQKGRIVFLAADCSSCHASPGQQDTLRLGGGLALAAPFGTFHAPNISPDREDGIGAWTTVDLGNALVSGVGRRGEHLYPALPYTSYTRMTHEDLRDLMAYLRTLPPVSGRPSAHELPFPFNIRRLVGFWKLAFFDRTPFQPDPQHDPAWERGRYLVEVLGHCAECHSSRNALGAIKSSTRFAGGRDQEQAGFVPNITPGRIGDWSAADIVSALADGRTPGHRRIGSSMADVVANTSQLALDDRQAIAAYLKSLPERQTPSP